jgi:hypothetical protein
MTLIVTVGASTSDSYATLAEAEAYMATLIFKTEWLAATDLIKEAALKQAARLMNNLGWVGTRYAQDQALAWPRCQGYTSRGVAEDYVYDADGWPVYWDTIPICVKNAQAEFAFRLLAEDRSQDAGSLAPETVKIGSLEVGKRKHKIYPDSVISMISQFLTSRPGCIQGVRG